MRLALSRSDRSVAALCGRAQEVLLSRRPRGIQRRRIRSFKQTTVQVLTVATVGMVIVLIGHRSVISCVKVDERIKGESVPFDGGINSAESIFEEVKIVRRGTISCE